MRNFDKLDLVRGWSLIQGWGGGGWGCYQTVEANEVLPPQTRRVDRERFTLLKNGGRPSFISRASLPFPLTIAIPFQAGRDRVRHA